jgi:hypothetical protein
MEKIKTILDREPVSSDYIRSKENFDKVKSNANIGNQPLYKSGWFYGTIGLSSVAVVLGINSFNNSAQIAHNHEQNIVKSEISMTPVVEEPKELVNEIYDASAETEIIPVEFVFDEPVDKVNGEVANSEVENPEIAIEVDAPKKPVFAKKPPPQIPKVNGVINKMPRIGDVMEGAIDVRVLCDHARITSSPDIEVTSFKISFDNEFGSTKKAVEGNVIPTEICKDIENHNLNSLIFISEIKGVSDHGERLMLSPMRLIPTRMAPNSLHN